MIENSTKPDTRQRGERGQAIILFVGLFTVIALMAAIVIDFGLWFSERQGARKDADASTLAGAFELLGQDFINPGNNNIPAVQAAAEAAAIDWAGRNGVAPEDVHNIVVANTSCFGPSSVLDSVELDVEHQSSALFASIFGMTAPEIGGHARACLGSIVSASGLMPLGVQISGVESECWAPPAGGGEEQPIFGQLCTISFGAGDTTSGEAGNLRLYNDGTSDCSGRQTGGNREFLNEIESGGADTTCHVLPTTETCDSDPGGCAWPLTGVGSRPQLNAFQELLSSEGACDGNGNGIDDFLEVVYQISGAQWPSTSASFAEQGCDSPRLVSLIILEQFDVQGNAPAPIIAFASFFILGCENADEVYDEHCNLPGGQGQIRLQGYLVNLLVTSGATGQINAWSPKRIILTE